jgi:hypothetical protein
MISVRRIVTQFLGHPTRSLVAIETEIYKTKSDVTVSQIVKLKMETRGMKKVTRYNKNMSLIRRKFRETQTER